MFKEPDKSPWYEDGIEDNEQCWRMDIGNNVQLQLFAQTPDEEQIHPDYHFPRLFWEKDVREANNSDNRIHYACHIMNITEEEAVVLLSLDADQLRSHLADLLETLDELPNVEANCGTIEEQRARLIPVSA